MNRKPKIKPVILQRALQMRHEPTKAEQRLWNRLRRCQLGGYKFRRQHPIGNYIVDFYCHQTNLIIEVDGDIHAFQENQDAERAAWLKEQGYSLIRFNNSDVFKNLDGVLQVIFEYCENLSP